MNTRCVVVGTAFIAYGHYIMSAYGVRTGKGCKEAWSNIPTLQLQCSNDEWIHVEHEAYGDVDGDAATCRLKSAAACIKFLNSSQNGLVVNCNGKQLCFEAMIVQTINNCNVTDPAAEVKYNCIKGSVNMCSPVTTTVNGSVYLHSPGFPDGVGVNSSCLVRITGQTLQVTLVQQRMRSGMLNISSDGRQLWTNVNVNQYNRVLSGRAAEIVIVYDSHDQDGSNLWIHVAGSGQMNITISGEMLDASTTTTSTQRLPSSQRTSGPGTSDTSTQTPKTAQFTTIAFSETVTSTRGHTTHTAENIATRLPSKSTPAVSTIVLATATRNSGDVVIALSVVCGTPVLIIVVLVIYFMVVKPFRKKHNTSSNTGTSVAHGETNVYDGIRRDASDTGDEHNYGHITSSGGSFYVNSVSGDDPYVNT